MYEGEKTWRGGMSGRSRDVHFVRCPGMGVIVIYTARWDPWEYKKRKHEMVPPNSFEGVVLDYLEERYRSLGIKNEVISHQPIRLGGYEAMEVIINTEEEDFESCESLNKKMRSERNKYVVIKNGNWGYGYFSVRAKWPAMIVLWYGSPIENYDEGASDFDRMVQTFRFVKD